MTTHRPNLDMYTARQIAAGVDMSRQRVFKALQGVPPSGQVLQGGKPVNAWALMDMPGELRARLDARAQQLCFADAGQLLERGKIPWQPQIDGNTVSLRDIAEKHIQKAHLVKRALLPIMEKLSDLDSLASVEERGLKLYKEALGHTVTPRHWRRLVERTFNRDAGHNNFQCLEIYLDQKLSLKPTGRTKAAEAAPDAFADARHSLHMVADFTKPTPKEKLLIWAKVFSAIEELVAGGMREKDANKAALQFLNNEALFIAKNADALRTAFYRKLKAWKKSGGKPSAIKDRRNDKSGFRRAPVLSEQDRLALLAQIAICGGRVAQGWRECIQQGLLSPEITSYYSFDIRTNKSYVPAKIRQAVGSDAAQIDEHVHGPHTAKMAGAYLDRDPSTINAGDWNMADETTDIIYVFDPRDPRKPIRCQLMIMIDFRTGFILSFVLAAAKTFNARDIRNLMTKTQDTWGLPRRGWYYEKGLFVARAVKEGIVSWADTEAGVLAELGLRFVHAREARAKTVERSFGLLQNHMERLPGYAGRNERFDRYERNEKLLQQIRGGKLPGREYLLTQEELHDRMHEIIEIVNNEPQCGKFCNGRSPREAYMEFFGNEPLVKLGRTTRYLFADTIQKVKVGRNGITLRRGKETFIYKSEDTGRLKGRFVLAWFSPENPEVLSVTDLNKKNPFTVERAQAVPAMDADPDLLSQELERNEKHNAYGKRLYKAIAPHLPDHFIQRMFRPTLVDEQTAELGLEIEHQREQATKKRKKKTTQQQKIAKAGIKPSPIAEIRADQARALANPPTLKKASRG